MFWPLFNLRPVALRPTVVVSQFKEALEKMTKTFANEHDINKPDSEVLPCKLHAKQLLKIQAYH